jgi:hypothetical protein
VFGRLRACFWYLEHLKITFVPKRKIDISRDTCYNFFCLGKAFNYVFGSVGGRAFRILNISKLHLDDIEKVTFHVILVTIFFVLAMLLIKCSAVLRACVWPPEAHKITFGRNQKSHISRGSGNNFF